MHVANLELSKKLYELSEDWGDETDDIEMQRQAIQNIRNEIKGGA